MSERFSAENADSAEKYREALEFIQTLKLADWPGGPVDAKDGRVHASLLNDTRLMSHHDAETGPDVAEFRDKAVADLRQGDPAKARALVAMLAEGLKEEWPEADKEAVDRFKATVAHMQEALGS